MVIDFWRGGEWLGLEPKEVVFVPYLRSFCDEALEEEQMCDYAYTTLEEAGAHWWFDRGNSAYVKTMNLDDYLMRHLTEIRGMNPFWDTGRLDVLAKWTKKQEK